MISCYIESYTYQQKQRPTDSLACRNSTTSMLTLDASERLYQPISLFTYFYLHAVQNSFIYNTDYQLSHKPILIWRSTHITELKITLGRVWIGLGCACMLLLSYYGMLAPPHRSLCFMCILFVYNLCIYIV